MLLMILKRRTHSQIMTETGCSLITVIDYMDYFRKLVALCINEETCRIESDGVEVEVDESTFAK